MALGIALGADRAVRRQIGEHLGQRHRRLPLEAPRRLRRPPPRPSSAGPVLRLRLFCLRLLDLDRFLARLDRRRIDRDVADQPLAERALDRAPRAGAWRSRLRQARRTRARTSLRSASRPARSQPHSRRSARVDLQPLDQHPGLGQAQHRFGHEGAGDRMPVLERPSGPAVAHLHERLDAHEAEHGDDPLVLCRSTARPRPAARGKDGLECGPRHLIAAHEEACPVQFAGVSSQKDHARTRTGTPRSSLLRKNNRARWGYFARGSKENAGANRSCPELVPPVMAAPRWREASPRNRRPSTTGRHGLSDCTSLECRDRGADACRGWPPVPSRPLHGRSAAAMTILSRHGRAEATRSVVEGTGGHPRQVDTDFRIARRSNVETECADACRGWPPVPSRPLHGRLGSGHDAEIRDTTIFVVFRGAPLVSCARAGPDLRVRPNSGAVPTAVLAGECERRVQ